MPGRDFMPQQCFFTGERSFEWYMQRHDADDDAGDDADDDADDDIHVLESLES